MFPLNLTDPVVVNRVENISQLRFAVFNVCYKHLLSQVSWTRFPCILFSHKGDPCSALPGQPRAVVEEHSMWNWVLFACCTTGWHCSSLLVYLRLQLR